MTKTTYQSQKEGLSTDLCLYEGICYIRKESGELVAARSVGYFNYHRWRFVVYSDPVYLSEFRVIEASTGAAVNNYFYGDVIDAYEDTLRFLAQKKFFLSTIIGNICVKHGSLFFENCCTINLLNCF